MLVLTHFYVQMLDLKIGIHKQSDEVKSHKLNLKCREILHTNFKLLSRSSLHSFLQFGHKQKTQKCLSLQFSFLIQHFLISFNRLPNLQLLCYINKNRKHSKRLQMRLQVCLKLRSTYFLTLLASSATVASSNALSQC